VKKVWSFLNYDVDLLLILNRNWIFITFFKDRPHSEVPVHRTINKEQPLVFPSTIETADRAVEPLEDIHNHGNFPYGPRALHVEALENNGRRRKRSPAKILSRTERSTELGVRSGYEVVSEVDLDFTPGEENANQERVTVFQVQKKSKKLDRFKTYDE